MDLTPSPSGEMPPTRREHRASEPVTTAWEVPGRGSFATREARRQIPTERQRRQGLPLLLQVQRLAHGSAALRNGGKTACLLPPTGGICNRAVPSSLRQETERG